MSTKGSWQRADVDKAKFNDAYDKIFKQGKYEEPDASAPSHEPYMTFLDKDTGEVDDTDD